MAPYLFQRGETVQLALEVLSGDPSQIGRVSAALQAVTPGTAGPDPGRDPAAQFTVAYAPADDSTPARWILSLSAALTLSLTADLYIADARLETAGGVVITEPVWLRLRNAVTQS